MSPLLWGDQAHVRELFGAGVDHVAFTPGSYVERIAGGLDEYVSFYKETFGPAAIAYQAIADQPKRVAELDGRFLKFATVADHGHGDAAELIFEYVVVVACRRAVG